jgi:hypothetical protein
VQKEKRERQYQKEKESFTNWMKEQWKEVEKDMERRLKEAAKQIRKRPIKLQPFQKKEKRQEL